MFKRLRRLRKFLFGLILLLALLAVGLVLWADDAARKGLEWAGRRTLEVPVDIADLRFSLWRRDMCLSDVTVANPPGFRLPNMMHLKEATLTLELRSLTAEKLHVRHLRLEGLTVNLEQQGGISNLQKVIALIPKPYEPNYVKGRSLHIDLLEINAMVVRAKLTPLPGAYDTVDVTLDPIRMENLGDREHLDSAVLSSKILLAISESILERLGLGIGSWQQRNQGTLERINRFGRGLERFLSGPETSTPGSESQAQ